MSFADLPVLQHEAIARLAHTWLVEPLKPEYVGGGRNSRVYRVQGLTGQDYALKVYFQQPGDHHDRLGTEFTSLSFLWQHQVSVVPQPLSHDHEAGIGLYEYVSGTKVPLEAIRDVDIDATADFAAHLRQIAAYPDAQQFEPASEAYFSIETIYQNIQYRLNRLLEGQRPGNRNPQLEDFLHRELTPTLDQVTRWLCTQTDWQAEIPAAHRTLSPSDFGFHNMLRRANGQFVFLDFEYFGWDDPGKLVSDFLLHPAMNLSFTLRQRFAKRIVEQFQAAEWLPARVKHVYPLFGIKWCLICLNEFLPEHQQRRQFAAASDQDWKAVQSVQLNKAQHILHRITQEYEQFPYFD